MKKKKNILPWAINAIDNNASVQHRKWSPDRNDLQIGPQMILDVDLKWSRGKTKNSMEFVPRVEISIFYTKQKQAITDHILYRYNSHHKIVPRIDYHKSSVGTDKKSQSSHSIFCISTMAKWYLIFSPARLVISWVLETFQAQFPVLVVH